MTPPHSGPRLRNGLTPLAKALALALGITFTGLTTIAAPSPRPGGFAQHAHSLRQTLEQLRQQLSQNPQFIARLQRARSHPPLASAPAVGASTLAVNSCVDDSNSLTTPGTLRYEVVNANDGDTIDLSSLACSTVTLTQGELPVSVNNLTLVGPSSGTFTIDGNGNGRVFGHSGNGTLTLQNLTVSNGYTYGSGGLNAPSSSTPDAVQAMGGAGGCMYSNGEIDLNNAVVTGCYAAGTIAVGGAVYAYSLHMQSSTISNSEALGIYYGAGGGAYAYELSMQSSTIAGNTVQSYVYASLGGGAIAKYAVPLVDSQITGNNATSNGFAMGGGLFAKYAAVEGGTISGNIAYAYYSSSAVPPPVAFGGGVAAKYAISMQTSTVSGNTAHSVFHYNNGTYDFSFSGGIIAGYEGGPASYVGYSTIDSNQAGTFAGGMGAKYGVHVVQSTISGNSAKYAGGLGAYGQNGATEVTIANSTIARNTAMDYGGGLTLGYDHSNATLAVTLQSSLISNNTAGISGSDIYAKYYSPPPPPPVPDGSPTPQASTVTIAGANNLVMDAHNVTLPGDTLSADPILQPLANNGGPTRTHSLGPGSPASNAGNNTYGFQYDQRGPGFARVGGAAADIGAVETDAVVAGPVNVPALSVWGVGLLASLLGWLGLRRRRRDAT